MFPRFLVLLASLSLLVSSVSAANLRRDSATAALSDNIVEIPADHEKATMVYKSFMKQVEKRNKNSEKYAKDSIAAAHVNARKHVEDLHKAGKLAEAKRQGAALMSSNGPLIRNGAFVTRRRPNGDCSGIVSNIDAMKIDGSCQSDGFGGSYSVGCAHEDGQGNVQMLSSYFTEEGCMNGWWSDQVVRSEPKCSFDHYGQMEEYGAPAMMAAQCTSNNMGIAIQSGGITHAFFAQGDDTCSGSPKTLHVQRYGACELVYATDDNDNKEGFLYMTMDWCAPETGKTQWTLYTDSACRRPVYRGSFNIGGMNGAPYGACTHHGDGDFAQTICFAEGGMP